MAPAERLAGRFSIGSFLGAGAMGEVYVAWDERDGRQVAVKRLRPELLREAARAEPSLLERFAREGEILRAASHPNIVNVLAVLNDEPSGPAIVMEYVPGGGLNALLEREPRLPLDRVLSLALDLSDALARAHRLGIVHRDLKPANVLLAENGTPRLTDFGIAHLPEAGSLTGTGVVLGTLPYLSPEAWDGAPPDARTDVWAFGVMLYEMLAGRRPFVGRFPGLLHAAIATREPVPITTLRPDVPPALAGAVASMLVKDPIQRMSSVRELSVIVERLIAASTGSHPTARVTSWVSTDDDSARRLTHREPTLHLTTFGGFSMTNDGRPVDWTKVPLRKLALLAVLARAGDRGISLDALVALLCSDVPVDEGRLEVTQTVDTLRANLGAEDAIIGVDTLRLSPNVVRCDVVEFEAAIADEQVERAKALYKGPFLDGFHLPGVPEFRNWLDAERRALAQAYIDVLVTVAGRAAAHGDHAVAIDAWRRLAATDPLSPRWAKGLMTALADAGQVSAAIQHARMYELLVALDIDQPSDRDVLALADRLGAETAERESRTAVASGGSPAAVLEPVASPANPQLPESTTKIVVRDEPQPVSRVPRSMSRPAWFTRRTAAVVATIVVGAVAVLVAQLAAGGRWESRASQTTPVVAVGRIADYRAPQTGFAGAVGDLLATNLARAPGVRLVSAVRMRELAVRLGGGANGNDPDDPGLAEAARRAGATDLVDGMLFTLPGGGLRLDLRLVDLTSGQVRAAQSVSGADVFALVDSGTARLLETMGTAAPLGGVGSVTTRSRSAYRLYAEGRSLYARGDVVGAHQLFAQALREDSAFAMATYYLAISGPDSDIPERVRLLDRALRLSASATDRERLLIRAGWALTSSSPTLAAIADTLTARYPDEVEGPLYVGLARLWGGDFLGSIPYFERVIARDSQSLRSLGGRGSDGGAGPVACSACVALHRVVTAYQYADSLDAAEKAVRRWMKLQPDAALPWRILAWVLLQRDKIADAQRANRVRAERMGNDFEAATFLAETRIWSGDFDGAEALLKERLELGGDRQQLWWFLTSTYLQQGRLAKALDAAHEHRRLTPIPPGGSPVTQEAVAEGFVLFEMQRYREAAALFDSVAQWRQPGLAPSWYARNRAWALTQKAMALAALGDTAALVPLVDTVRVYGAQSFLGRDQRLHHHVRALLLLARHDDDGAIGELRAATFSPTLDYARTPYLLAGALLRRGRAPEAIAVLQPALRGSLQSSNFFATRTELHELLAQAWDASRLPNAKDSAAVHWRAVAHAWSHADPPLRARGAAAESH